MPREIWGWQQQIVAFLEHSYDHCMAKDRQGLLKLGQSQTKLLSSWCTGPGHWEDHWAIALTTHCSHRSDAVQCLCLYRICIFQGKLLSITSSLHHFWYSYPQLNQLYLNHLSSRGSNGEEQGEGVLPSLWSRSWFQEVFWAHESNVPPSCRLFVPMRRKAKIWVFPHVISQKWLKINQGKEYYVSWLWFSQLLARNTTKSLPLSCICGLPLQASATFACCISKAILFFKDQS